MNRPSLKQIATRQKRLAKGIEFQKSITKEGVPNPTLERLEASQKNIGSYVEKLTDPKSAIRCSLPKKQQRKLNLLPPVGYVAPVEVVTPQVTPQA